MNHGTRKAWLFIYTLFALAACTSSNEFLPTPSFPPTQPISSPLSSPIPDRPTRTISPISPSETFPPSTLPPSETAVQTEKTGENLIVTIKNCLQTFCPPYWIEEQARTILDLPGIQDALGLDETDILIRFDPKVFTKDEVIELFMDLTGLDVAPIQ